jgi:hypothetical protein
MKETNLNNLYQFGASLDHLQERISIDMKIIDLFPYLIPSQDWLRAFLKETEEFWPDLKDTRHSSQHLLNMIAEMIESARSDMNRPITQLEVASVIHGKDELEKNFEREHRNLSVFTVTRKGTF